MTMGRALQGNIHPDNLMSPGSRGGALSKHLSLPSPVSFFTFLKKLIFKLPLFIFVNKTQGGRGRGFVC